MFCPNCRAEYRSGFSSCSDCGASLVEALPSSAKDVEARKGQFPSVSRSHFLTWFVPMIIGVALLVAEWFGPPPPFRNSYVMVVMFIFIMTQNIGAFWMLYQGIRYEKRVLRYAILAFVPFMFIWYGLVRVPLRRESQGNSEFIRH
jgi:hypothetical protein